MKRDTVNPCAIRQQRTANLFGPEFCRREDRTDCWIAAGVAATRLAPRTRAGDAMGNHSTAAGGNRAGGGNAHPGVARYYFPL